MIIVAVKIFIRGSNTASTLGSENEFRLSTSAPKSVPEPSLPEIPDSTSESTSQSTTFIAEIMACINAEPPRIIDARDRLNEMLSMPMSGRQLALVKKQLSKLSEEWL
ncbi:unnamed protein product, partial [marine sediment metagenome]